MRIFTARGILPLLAVSFGLLACKDDGIAEDKYVDAWPGAVCDAIVVCNCEYPNGALYDHCRAELEVASSTLAELNDVEGLQFDGVCAQKEIDAVGSLGCGVPVLDPDAACETPCKVWHGPMGKGGTCTSINGYDNCKQGMVCPEGVCVHPCEEPDLPKIGEACAPQYGCVEGAYCDVETAPLFPVCAALPVAGARCVEALGNLCAEDLICDVSDPAAPTCATLPLLGEECPEGACARGLYCDTAATPFVCATPPALGEACPLGLCELPNSCEDGTCVAPRPAVCGYYGGLPVDNGSGTAVTNGPGTGELDTGLDTGGFETGGFETGGLETGGFDSSGGVGDLGDCCIPHETPACSNVDAAACVCAQDEACCVDPWSETCVAEIATFGCGAC